MKPEFFSIILKALYNFSETYWLCFQNCILNPFQIWIFFSQKRLFIYLKRRISERERQSHQHHSLHGHNIQGWLAQIKAKSLEFHVVLQHGWQWPKHLGHQLLTALLGVLAGSWIKEAGVMSSGLTCCVTTLPIPPHTLLLHHFTLPDPILGLLQVHL